MSIRKVSDLPELEIGDVTGKTEQDLNDSYIEVSMMSSIYEGESRVGMTYASKKTTFKTLRDFTVSRLSALLSSEWVLCAATYNRLGGVKVNLSNDVENNRYGVSSDSDSRLFIEIPSSERVESVDGISPDAQGRVFLNSISNVVVDNNYLSVLSKSTNRDLSIVLNMHMGPDFTTYEALTKDDITAGVSATESDMFVYMGLNAGNADAKVTCKMSKLSSTDWKDVQKQFVQSQTDFGTSFNLRKGYSVRMDVSQTESTATIAGYKCNM